MEYLWIFLGGLLLLIALIGCVFPVLPGSPLAYVSLLLLLLINPHVFSLKFLLIMAVLHILVQLLDFILPMIGAKRFGAGKYGIWGSILGMVVGMIFFPPFGIFLGVLVGAVVGELWAGKQTEIALKAGIASFAFSMLSLLFKLVLVFVTTWYFVQGSAQILSGLWTNTVLLWANFCGGICF